MMGAPFHHLCILVADIDAAIAELGPSLGVTFRDPITVASLRVDPDEFADDAPHPVEARISFSIEGPPYYELSESHGSGIHSLERYGPGMHHLGLFVDNLPDAVAVIERRVSGSLSSILTEEGDMLAWYSKPSPAIGLIIELMDRRLEEPIRRYVEEGEGQPRAANHPRVRG